MSRSELSSRGAVWMHALTCDAAHRAVTHDYGGTLQVVDASLAESPARFIAVVPDANNRFPRARHGEVGLIEG